MKTIVYAALAATALALATAPRAAAQDDAEPRDSEAIASDPGAGKPQAGAPGDKMMARLTTKLGLSDDQAAKLKATFQAHREAVRVAHDHARMVRAKLREQVDSKAPDADIKATLEHLRADQRALLDSQEEFEGKLASFLTPTQRAKLLLGFMEHRRGMKDDRPMRGAMRGGPDGD